MSTLVLERRHVLGGAAVTEEVFPGFRFSVCSYVVSLLRPEIIRELSLPSHGLEILPLDGTITPLDDDYLWRVNDHGKTMREIRRWSPTDAEAYEEYGQLMVDMARFIKPILSIVPPDPGRFDPREWLPLVGLAKAFRDLSERQQAVFVQLMTMSATDFLRAVVRDRPADRHDVGVGDHRDVPGRALAGHRVRPAAPLHGRDRRRVPRVGDPARRHRRRVERDRLGRPRARRGDPDRGAGRADRRAGRPGHRRALESGEEIEAGIVLSSLDVRKTFLELIEPSELDRRLPPTRSRRYKFRGSSGKVNLALDAAAGFQMPARPGRAPARRDLVLAVGRLHGAGLRRREVRPLQPAAVHRHDHPDAGRPVDGAAGQAHHLVLRPVRAVPPGRGDVGRRSARRVRRRR